MDRSFINEIYTLASPRSQKSQVPHSSSYISSQSDNDNGLRKSRIIKLPNYNPIDMSNKRQFVAVFQAIQIQRLLTQVQSLRLNNKDLERKLTNFQNYEVQIRELTEKCIYYQSERQYHRLQMNRLIQDNEILAINNIRSPRQIGKAREEMIDKRCLQLAQQVEKWKIRFNALEISNKKEREQMRKSTDSLRNSMITQNNSQTKTTIAKLQAERISLQAQVQQLKQKKQSKDIQIERLNTQIARMNFEISDMKNSTFGNVEYETKIAMLNSEIFRLNDLLKFKNQQIFKLNQQQKLNRQKNKLSNLSSSDYQQISSKLELKQRQYQQLQTRFTRIVEENKKNQVCIQKNQQLQRLLDKSDLQLSKVNQILQEKIKQCQHWREKYKKSEAQYKNKKSIFYQYSSSASRNNHNNHQQNRELLQTKENQVAEFKAKYNDIDKIIQNFKIIQKEKKSMEEQLHHQTQIAKDYEEKIKSLEQAVSRANKLQSQSKNWQFKKTELTVQIQRLNSNIQIKNRQAQNYTKKIVYFEQELKKYKSIEIQLNEQKKKSQMMAQEIEKIQKILIEKQNQFNNLKEKISNTQFSSNKSKQFDMQFKIYGSQIQKLINKLNEAHKQSFSYQQKVLQAQAKVGKAQSQIDSLMLEQQRNVTLLNQKSSEIQLLKQQCAVFQKQMKQLRQHYKQERKNAELLATQNIKKVQKRLRQQILRSQNFNTTTNILHFQINKLKNQGSFPQQFINQFRTLKASCQMKEKEIKLLQQRIQKSQRILAILKSHVEKQNKILKVNKQNWILISQKYQTFAQFTKHMINEYDKITQVYVENIYLQSQARMKNFQLQQSHNMSRSFLGDTGVDPETNSMKSLVSMLKIKGNLSMTRSDIYDK